MFELKYPIHIRYKHTFAPDFCSGSSLGRVARKNREILSEIRFERVLRYFS